MDTKRATNDNTVNTGKSGLVSSRVQPLAHSTGSSDTVHQSGHWLQFARITNASAWLEYAADNDTQYDANGAQVVKRERQLTGPNGPIIQPFYGENEPVKHKSSSSIGPGSNVNSKHPKKQTQHYQILILKAEAQFIQPHYYYPTK